MQENNILYDFIFYHIPKCGGSSIRSYLKTVFLNKTYSDNDIEINNFKNINIKPFYLKSLAIHIFKLKKMGLLSIKK